MCLVIALVLSSFGGQPAEESLVDSRLRFHVRWLRSTIISGLPVLFNEIRHSSVSVLERSVNLFHNGRQG
jgi:hypothetical protein